MRHDSQLVSYLRLRTQGASTLILRVSPYKSGWGWSRRSCRQEPVWFMRSEVLVPIRERLPCPPAPWSSTNTMYLPARSLVKYYYYVLASLLPGQPVNVRTSARRLEKWTRHRVAFNYPYLQSGLLCNWPPTPASRNCTPSLGTTWRQSSWKSNKHFFTDKRSTKYLCCPDFKF